MFVLTDFSSFRRSNWRCRITCSLPECMIFVVRFVVFVVSAIWSTANVRALRTHKHIELVRLKRRTVRVAVCFYSTVINISLGECRACCFSNGLFPHLINILSKQINCLCKQFELFRLGPAMSVRSLQLSVWNEMIEREKKKTIRLSHSELTWTIQKPIPAIQRWTSENHSRSPDCDEATGERKKTRCASHTHKTTHSFICPTSSSIINTLYK